MIAEIVCNIVFLFICLISPKRNRFAWIFLLRIHVMHKNNKRQSKNYLLHLYIVSKQLTDRVYATTMCCTKEVSLSILKFTVVSDDGQAEKPLVITPRHVKGLITTTKHLLEAAVGTFQLSPTIVHIRVHTYTCHWELLD